MRLNKLVIFTIVMLIFTNFVMLFHQYRFMKRGDTLSQNKKYIWAIDYYSYTILSFTPFSPFIEKAEKKILKIAKQLYKNNNLYGSLFAYEILRSSYFQVRSFYQPRKKLIDKLNYKIAKIKVEILKKEDRLEDEKKEFQKQLAILKHNDFPSVFGSFIMCFSFLLWIGAILFMILKGFEKEKANKKIILISSLLYLIFFSIWIISLYIV